MTTPKWRPSLWTRSIISRKFSSTLPRTIYRWLKHLIPYGSLQFFQSTWPFFVTFALRWPTERSHTWTGWASLEGTQYTLLRAITCSGNNARTLAIEARVVIEVASFFWNHTWPMLISRLAKFRHNKFCNHIQVSILKNHSLSNFSFL